MEDEPMRQRAAEKSSVRLGGQIREVDEGDGMNRKEPEGLKGQVVIVTGGGSGIGRATCVRMAQSGAAVVMVDVNSRSLDETGHILKKGGCETEPIPLTMDIRSEGQMSEMIQATMERYGRIDILVHSAGILRAKDSGPKVMTDIAVSEWDEVMEVNLKGTFLINRAVLPVMIKQRYGQIVNISSTSGLKGRAFDSVYCASKFGVLGLSQSLAEEVRSYGIRVNVILPDAVNTPMWEQNGPIRAPGYALDPSQVADLICYVVSLPMDTVLGDLAILPFKTRRRKDPAS
jgi:NAD(P)-dependent dehydrogenase (short-subunit alcohol dehydrogenase family)